MKCKSSQISNRSKRSLDASLNIPMDYPWKVLNAMVSDLSQSLLEDDVLLLSQIIRDRDVAALLLLDDVWGLTEINRITPDSNVELHIIRARYQVAALLKKFQFATEKEQRIDSAIKKFKQAEDSCSTYNRSGYMNLIASGDQTALVLTYAREFLRKLLGDTCITSSLMTDGSRHGPGSNLDTYKGQTSLYDKYANWPYSCTQRALPYAQYLIATDARWRGALEHSYRERFCIPMHYPLNMRVFWTRVFKVVPGNVISFVPKNALTERTVAKEPTMNMMLQLGVDHFIRTRLKRWDIDLDSQVKNQLLAFRGSTDDGPESFVTFDLSMASDSISLKLCELVLPPEWYSYLCAIRSPQGVMNGEVISYEKISSMGCGYTFVLESAIFAAFTAAAIRSRRGDVDWRRDLSVFGDDLIVRKSDASACIDALQLAGFTLNTEKSFLKGPVRESCGTDWYQGAPVRPVFLKTLPIDFSTIVTDLNRLQRILELRWGITESETVKRIGKWIPSNFMGFSGPLSDTDFDSYTHVHRPSGRYKNCVWRYKRLVKKPVERKCEDFLFRKLMHNLKGPLPNTSFGGKVVTGGNRFTVIRSNAETVATSYSVADVWRSTYAEAEVG